MNTKNIIICGVLLLAVFSACSDEDYKLYDASQQNAVFFEYVDEEKQEVVTSVNYVFGYDLATVHTIEIPVKLMGMPADKDLAFSIIPGENTDMIKGTHYAIDENSFVIPANKVETIVKVNLLRDNDELLKEREYTLNMQLTTTDDLRPVGQTSLKIVYSDIPPARPEWWMEYYGMPNYTFEAAQMFFEYFLRVRETSPTMYNTLIAEYGDYFIKAKTVLGPIVKYRNFLIKYVLIPMYEDTKDNPEFTWETIPAVSVN